MAAILNRSGKKIIDDDEPTRATSGARKCEEERIMSWGVLFDVLSRCEGLCGANGEQQKKNENDGFESGRF